MSSESNPIRIVIADEHGDTRQELRMLLESEPGLLVIGDVPEVHGALRLARQNKPDILLTDFALAQNCEAKAMSDFARDMPSIRTVVMIAEISKSLLVEAFRLGAHAVVLKRSTRQILLRSIRSVMAGQYWLEGEGVGVLVEALRDSLAQGAGTKSAKEYGLTRREVDIISKIASGQSNKEVGEEFAISERTVKHHLTNIFGKVGVSSRLQLALFAVNQHLTAGPLQSLTVQPVQSDDDL